MLAGQGWGSEDGPGVRISALDTWGSAEPEGGHGCGRAGAGLIED